MTRDELLQRWKAMSGDSSSRAWAPENAHGFLHGYCREPKSMRRALRGVPCASAIAKRLSAVFSAARDDADHAYLRVKRAPRLAEKDAISLAKSHLRSLFQMAGELGHEETQAIVERIVDFRVTRQAPANQPTRVQTLFFELEGDWFRHVCDDVFARAMREATYSLAADPLLAHYILWPLTRRRSDPYAAYFELWRHGAKLRWPELDQLSIHLHEG